VLLLNCCGKLWLERFYFLSLLPSQPLSERRKHCDARRHAVTLCVCPPHYARRRR